MNIVKLFLGVALGLLTFFSSHDTQAATVSGLLQDTIDMPRITLRMTNAPLDDIMKAISKQTGIDYGYQLNNVDKLRRFSIDVKEQTLKTTLDKLFAGSDYSYIEQADRIVVVKREKAITSPTDSIPSLLLRGKVIDKQGLPIPGATITVQGTRSGVATNNEGEFSLTCPPRSTIEIRFIGFKTQEKQIIKSDNDLVITLEEDIKELDQVVITGIFEKEKSSYTGAQSTISSKELKMFRGQNLLQTLNNIDPALNIVQDNAMGSNPNALPEINIRGNSSLPTSMVELNQGVSAQLNTPLIILDGFEISLQRLIDLNDEDVDNITILKDAAATAIYGSKGANGVIVITTRKPQAGDLRVYIQAGINLELPDLSSYDLFKAEEKLEFEKALGLYEESGFPADIPRYREYYEHLYDIRSGVETDWMSQPLRNSVGQRYNLRMEGGNREFRWSLSLGFNQNAGVMKESQRSAFNGGLNISYSLKNLIFQNQLSISNSKGVESPYGSFSEYASMNPYWKIYNEHGVLIPEYKHSAFGGRSTDNPLYDTQFSSKEETASTNITNNFSVDWNITEGLTARGRFSISKGFNTSDTFFPADHSNFSGYSGEDYFRRGSYDYTTGQSFSLSGNITLSYSKRFAEKHQVDIGLDYSMSHSESYQYSFAIEGFNDDRFDFLANGAGYEKDGKPGGSESTSRSVGFTGNLTYTYNNCYFADLSYRLDGSSQFGSDRRFAPFWSIGLGWNVHNLSAFLDQNTLSQFKIRASYGQQGSQNFSPYQSQTMYQYSTDDRYLYLYPAILMGYGNDKLKWQTTRQFNFGIDFAFFNNRINGSFDCYTKTTSNLLSSRDIPYSTGFDSYIENIGKTQNKGVELSLSGYLVRNTESGFICMLTARMSHNTSKIKKLSEAIKEQNEFYLNQNVDMGTLLYEGKPMTTIYAVRSLGIAPSTGQEVFLDKDGKATYEWNANARVDVGNSSPKWQGNMSAMVQWKDLSLNLSFGYHWGGQQYNSTLLGKVEVPRSAARENLDRRAWHDRWMEPGDLSFYKSYYTLDGNEAPSSRMSSRFVQDDNMFTLQSASLQYRWHSTWLKNNLRMESLNISVNTSDLFYVSTIKRERGTGYPFSRFFSFALSANF